MRPYMWAIIGFIVFVTCKSASAQISDHATTQPAHAGGAAPVFVKYEDAKWQPIVPQLGPDGPDIAILHTDAKTGATQLLIRANAAMHVPKHFHSSNETHTVITGPQAFEC